MVGHQEWSAGSVNYDSAMLAVFDGRITQALLDSSVPTRVFNLFEAVVPPQQVVSSIDDSLFQLGLNVWGDLICVQAHDLAIVQLGKRSYAFESVVNTHLDNFLQFLAMVEAGYPFGVIGGGDEDDDDWDLETTAASEVLAAKMAAIDPEALLPGSFWDIFLSDVAIGNYRR